MENPLPPYKNYLAAQGFLERLRLERKKISKDDFKRLRDMALAGDVIGEIRVLRPRIGHEDQRLRDYNVRNGDLVYLVPDPIPG